MISVLENNVENPVAQIIFAHGAGADMHHEFMELVTLQFNKENVNVLRFNFPFMDKRISFGKRYPPDRMPKLIDCYKNVINNVIETNYNSQNCLPLFIGGKSMGSRVAASIACDDEIAIKVKGVFCFGYPFHPPKKTEKLRLEPLQETLKPILVVQGERDTLGSKIEVLDYEISKMCQLFFLADGDHSLKPRVKSGFTHNQHLEKSVKVTTDFFQEIMSND